MFGINDKYPKGVVDEDEALQEKYHKQEIEAGKRESSAKDTEIGNCRGSYVEAINEIFEIFHYDRNTKQSTRVERYKTSPKANLEQCENIGENDNLEEENEDDANLSFTFNDQEDGG